VLTFSTIQQQGETNTEDIIGKQLILTPQHEANGSIRIKYHNYHVEYLQEFVGQRYTTADNSEFLDPYTIGNIIIGYQTTLWKHKTQIRFRWNNLWNTQYESIPAYAMPLNNFEINLRIYFNQSKS
jgi:outer membrane cobalamin receptor